MTSKKRTQRAPDSPRGAHSPMPAGRRLLWSLAFAALLGSIALRVLHTRLLTPANATASIDMHEAAGFLDKQLAAMPANRQEQATLGYLRDSNPAIRHAAVDTLMTSRSPAATTAVEQAFADSDSEVRKRAMEVLIAMDPPRGLRLLLAGLRDGDSWIREDAATQLNMRAGRAHSGVGKESVPMLVRAITDENETVASTATHALNKLTGNPWHFSVLDGEAKRRPIITRWQQWWQQAQGNWPVSLPLADVPAQIPMRADLAPAFDVRDLEGKSFSSDDLKGKITLINFWGTWCGTCKVEIPALIKLDEMYRARNVAVVGLTVADKSRESVQTWCRANGVGYRQALSTDEARSVFGGIEEVPVSFLIDAQGRVRYQWDGDRDFATFQAAVERLLREEGK